MYPFIKLCMLVFVLSGGVYTQNCRDCVNYDQCPKAFKLAQERKEIGLLREAFCGYNQSGKITPKVCCSAISNADESLELEDTRIANHENLKLLPERCGLIQGDRILGGVIADLYEFPWMALISHKTPRGDNIFACGGSILNKRYVLTAAHCVSEKKIAGVRVGEYDISTSIDCQSGVCEPHIQDIPIETFVVHEKYHKLPHRVNDIALIRLGADIDFSHKNVDPICLPTTSPLRRRVLANENCTVTGWGLDENHSSFTVLRKAQVAVSSAQRCRSLYNKFAKQGDIDVVADQLCAGSEKKDSCSGDSGGPLMLEEKYDNKFRYVQYGIVSHGPRQCGSDYPGIYTDVTKYMGWILDSITP